MLNTLYAALGGSLLLGYSLVAFNGWEFGDEERHQMPASARHQAGGYHSNYFWHSGYRGGK